MNCNDCLYREVCDRHCELQCQAGCSTCMTYACEPCELFKDRTKWVEQKHGRWKYYHKQNKAVCTNCSFERDLDENFGRAIFCPNCGAKMEG